MGGGERKEGRGVQYARGGPVNRGWGDNWRGTIQITERGRVGAVEGRAG